MKKTIALTLPWLFLLALLSCSKTDKTENNSLVIIDSEKIDKESLGDAQKFSSTIPALLLLSPLLSLDGNGIPHNFLAEEIKLFPGKNVIEIRLREGVKFHDGRRLTVDDIVGAINKLRVAEVRYKNLKVETLNSSLLRLTNNAPVVDVNSLLADIAVLAPESSDQPVGTGPFRFGRWLNNGVELVANKDYFEGRPKLDKVIYLYEEDERKRLYKLLKGEADLLVFLSPEVARFLEKDTRFYLKKIPFSYSAIHFNNESALFRDKVVRKAVSMAIDRDSLIEKGFKDEGVKTSHPFQPEMLTKSESPDYQPREAARLLKEAGWRDRNKDGVLEKAGRRLRFLLYYDKDYKEYTKVLDIMSQHLFEVGIEMEGVPVTYSEFRKKWMKAGDYDAFLKGISTSDSANFTTWHSSFIGNPDGCNFSRYSNGEVDRLLEQLRVSGDIKTKKMIYGKILEIISKDVPAAFLYNDMIYTAVNKRFKGAEDFMGDVYSVYKIKDWSLNEDYR